MTSCQKTWSAGADSLRVPCIPILHEIVRISGFIRIAGIIQGGVFFEWVRYEKIPWILYDKPKNPITPIQTLIYDIAPQWSLHLGVGKVKSIVG